jgi:hypothetical protein
MKDKGQGRRGAKRRKNEEKRARRLREQVRRTARAREDRQRRQDIIAGRCKKVIARSRVGLGIAPGLHDLVCSKDGIGRINYEVPNKADGFVLTSRWREIPGCRLMSLEDTKWIPYLPKSPLEHLAECGV